MVYDVIIIGGGPSGLTAGIYASRARLKTLIIENYSTPAQAILTDLIENYPGFVDGIGGFELIERFKKQAEKFGAEIISGAVKSVKESLSKWQVAVDNKTFETLSVIIASGAKPKNLGIAGEKELTGRGVSYCATCDGAFFKDRDVVVIGGGDSALEEAIFLTRFVKNVKVVHRRDSLRAAKILQERALNSSKIQFILNSVVSSIVGRDKVTGIIVKDVKNGIESEVLCDGVFVFAGYTPNTEFIKGALDIDENGYIITKEDLSTNKKGIFACGDCCKKMLRQVVTACGDGALASFSCQKYIEELVL
jgi:thioredoxin reductase (NADPH)